MRILLFITVVFSQMACAALEFESKLVEVDASADAENATVDFKFSNQSDEPVTITKLDTSCDCLSVEVNGGTQQPGKTRLYQPGESGIVRGAFKIGNERGVVDQAITIWLEGDPKEQPSIQLTARIKVPKIINMTPRSLRWATGAKPEPKRIDLVMNHEQAIHITETKSSSSNFKLKLETVEEGKRYALWVHPVSTDKPGIAVIGVITDSPVKNQKNGQAFAMVQHPE